MSTPVQGLVSKGDLLLKFTGMQPRQQNYIGPAGSDSSTVESDFKCWRCWISMNWRPKWRAKDFACFVWMHSVIFVELQPGKKKHYDFFPSLLSPSSTMFSVFVHLFFPYIYYHSLCFTGRSQRAKSLSVGLSPSVSPPFFSSLGFALPLSVLSWMSKETNLSWRSAPSAPSNLSKLKNCSKMKGQIEATGHWKG